MNINVFNFKELIKKGYSLDILYITSLVANNVDISELRSESIKINAIYDTAIRKGLISEDGSSVTILGEELLKFLTTNDEIPLKKKIIKEDFFDEWWEIFPSNNKFVYKGIVFQPSRSFKVKKEDCKRLFNKIINDKEFTGEEIINATKYDIYLKKENSIKKRENQLTFLQNSYTYLNQRSFEGFIELIKDNNVEYLENQSTGTIDI